MGLWLTNPITKYWNTSWKPTNMHLKYDTLTKKEETLCCKILKREGRK